MICPTCSRQLPDIGARFCPNCGASLAAGTPEERKLVSILFADITGSTTLGERFDPERWRILLQRYFSVMASTIEAWGGSVQKFAGDAVMAAFGVPVVREDDAERALGAACEMLDRLNGLNHEFETRHGVQLSIRIGVNTGEVMSSPDQLIVLGDAVNVAARLEQMAEPGTILAGIRTYEAAREAFDFGPAEKRDARGRTEPVLVRRVLRRVESRSALRNRRQVPMVGREAEIERLASLFHEAMNSSSPQMALIVGQAGIGKSRLVQEFLNLASARHPHRVLLQGRCPSAGQNLTYWALGELLRRECRISLDDSEAVAAGRFRQTVEAVLEAAGLARSDIERTANALAITAGIKLPNNPLEEVRPSALDLEQGIAWPRWLSAYTRRGPLILLIEDLHWADERLLTMLERLLVRSTGPLLILGTSRPEFRTLHPDFLAGRDEVEYLALQPLSRPQTEALLSELLGRTPLQAADQEKLITTVDGNPFFLEEIVQQLIESGAMLQAAEGWQPATNSWKSALPDTVQSVLAARIDALPIREKHALQEAAVIGKVFWEGPLAGATQDQDVTATLFALEKKGLVVLRPTSTMSGDLEFAFKHALVRDVAYASLSLSRRAKAHAEAAAWMEETAGDRQAELAELIAHHYRSALSGEGATLAWMEEPSRHDELRAKAFTAMMGAGAQARKRFAIQGALDWHRQALELASTVENRLRVLEAIGDDQEAAFHGDDAVAAWEEAVLMAEGEPGVRLRLLLKCARMTGIRWGGFKTVPPTRKVDGYIDAALALNPDPHDRGWLLALRAYLNTRKGDAEEIMAVPPAERMRAGVEAAEIGKRLADVDLQVLALRSLSGLAVSAGDYQGAMELARREYELNDRIAASRDRALSTTFYVLRRMDIAGDYAGAMEAAEASYRLAKDLTIHEVQHATFLLIYGGAMLGRWPAIEPLLTEHLDCWRRELDIACPYARSGPLIGAWALAHQGRVAEARGIAESIPMDWTAPGLPEAWQGMVLLECGDALQARAHAERIVAVNRRRSYEEAPFEHFLMLQAMMALKHWDALDEFIPKAEAVSEGLAVLGPMCGQAVGLLAIQRGDLDGGADHLKQSAARFEGLGVMVEATRSLALLEQIARPV